ncbi:DUF1501 domain-containing protein [Pseudenhygromyxa sp. WMMC2535]|uniref:DUF1501 domain-containing protein n=1 Tax=Pseudenhygromyxa sp. WMMC2535 TaxID=2712867 RepID=UPI001557CB6F|nr:DUF1501 domain-containing protein [Pseudenhygromyxa sp. WMMC2535]NVB41214.1 DUF1501 domain-containing protein [Pseudenhygromyxa sp. WMMC2535]
MTHAKSSPPRPRWTRRGFMLAGCASAGALIYDPFERLALADDPNDPRRFLSLFFNGAWDVLLGPDSRAPGTYDGIQLGTDMLDAEFQDPIAVNISGTEVMWGAPMAEVVRHADVLTLFRGVNMNTVAHPTGRAYVNTFIPPAGVVPRGDSLGTRFASADDYGELIMPNFVIGMPTFNATFTPELTGVAVDKALQVKELVKQLGPSGHEQTEMLLRAAQDQVRGCVSAHYDGEVPEEVLGISRQRMRNMLGQGLEAAFSFADDPEILARYAIANANANNDPAVIAATIWRLIETGLTRTVSARLQTGLDTHQSNWVTNQPTNLRAGFDALGVLLDDLRVDDPNLEKTTVVVHSEFARTPKINGSGGRDHHFANSILVFGGGLRRGVCGATLEQTLGLLEIDVSTGLPSEGGHMLFPEDIGATLAHAQGLNYDAFRVEPLLPWIA